MTPELSAAISSIWRDQVVAQLLDEKDGSDFYLMDSAS